MHYLHELISAVIINYFLFQRIFRVLLFTKTALVAYFATPCNFFYSRVCGERTERDSRLTRMRGSSPRLRGTLHQAAAILAERRFIPAFAGNALAMRIAKSSSTVHPRVCGERSTRVRIFESECGSSPRLRGTPVHRGLTMSWTRFIPAFAGNAHGGRWANGVMAVHPRVCGERSSMMHCPVRIAGSSPRLRGTRRARLCLGHLIRFIPAFAGNAG